ncbi:hypothetical protein G9A89_000302 [Geosiphon pyriformis]|nr:hypothetical protein G9A89_000302 [Geosiphon pyriformis]
MRYSLWDMGYSVPPIPFGYPRGGFLVPPYRLMVDLDTTTYGSGGFCSDLVLWIGLYLLPSGSVDLGILDTSTLFATQFLGTTPPPSSGYQHLVLVLKGFVYVWYLLALVVIGLNLRYTYTTMGIFWYPYSIGLLGILGTLTSCSHNLATQCDWAYMGTSLAKGYPSCDMLIRRAMVTSYQRVAPVSKDEKAHPDYNI